MNDVADINDLILNKSACDKDVDIGLIIDLLPQWKTYILEAKIIDEDNIKKLSLRFLLNAHNEEQVKEWIAQLEESTKSNYSIYSTLDAAGKYVNFKQRLVCQHNTRHKNVYDPSTKSRKSTKNTNCPSKMTVVLHAIKKRYQGKDREMYLLRREMPCEVKFIPTHSHSALNADPLKFRKMSDEVKEKLLSHFRNGHSASTALESLKIDIQLNNDNFEEMLADRKHCPTYNDCYQLFKQFEKKYDIQELKTECLEPLESPCGENVYDSNMYIDKEPLEQLDSTTSAYCSNLNDTNMYVVDKEPLEPLDSTSASSSNNLNDTNMYLDKEPLEPLDSTARASSSNLNDSNLFTDKDLPIIMENIIETETINEEIVPNVDPLEVSLEETAKASAKVHLNNIYDVFTEFIDRSPVELAAGLKSMEETLKKLTNSTNLASYCMNFGPGIHRSPRKAKFLVKKTPLRRRLTRIINIPDITSISAEHNLTKTLQLNNLDNTTE